MNWITLFTITCIFLAAVSECRHLTNTLSDARTIVRFNNDQSSSVAVANNFIPSSSLLESIGVKAITNEMDKKVGEHTDPGGVLVNMALQQASGDSVSSSEKKLLKELGILNEQGATTASNSGVHHEEDGDHGAPSALSPNHLSGFVETDVINPPGAVENGNHLSTVHSHDIQEIHEVVSPMITKEKKPTAEPQIGTVTHADMLTDIHHGAVVLAENLVPKEASMATLGITETVGNGEHVGDTHNADLQHASVSEQNTIANTELSAQIDPEHMPVTHVVEWDLDNASQEILENDPHSEISQTTVSTHGIADNQNIEHIDTEVGNTIIHPIENPETHGIMEQTAEHLVEPTGAALPSEPVEVPGTQRVLVSEVTRGPSLNHASNTGEPASNTGKSGSVIGTLSENAGHTIAPANTTVNSGHIGAETTDQDTPVDHNTDGTASNYVGTEEDEEIPDIDVNITTTGERIPEDVNPLDIFVDGITYQRFPEAMSLTQMRNKVLGRTFKKLYILEESKKKLFAHVRQLEVIYTLEDDTLYANFLFRFIFSRKCQEIQRFKLGRHVGNTDRALFEKELPDGQTERVVFFSEKPDDYVYFMSCTDMKVSPYACRDSYYVTLDSVQDPPNQFPWATASTELSTKMNMTFEDPRFVFNLVLMPCARP